MISFSGMGRIGESERKQEFRAIEDVVRLYERLAVEKEKEFESVDKRDDPI